MSMRTLDVAMLKIPASRPLEPYEAAAIRGYLGRVFPKEPLLHHHLDKKFLYTYPKVQFKIIDGIAHIVGIDEGVLVINNIKDVINNLKLEKNRIEFYEPQIRIKKEQFGSSD
ncbi:MAG: CRISPR-associated endonuclease Cas6, partial [Candidatus Jordarchaeum sp.]